MKKKTRVLSSCCPPSVWHAGEYHHKRWSLKSASVFWKVRLFAELVRQLERMFGKYFGGLVIGSL